MLTKNKAAKYWTPIWVTYGIFIKDISTVLPVVAADDAVLSLRILYGIGRTGTAWTNRINESSFKFVFEPFLPHE